MSVGISGAIERDEAPILVGTQQVAIGRRRLSGSGDVVVFRLSGVEFELLLQVAGMLTYVADPYRRLEWGLVFQCAVPGLNPRVLPVPRVPDRRRRSAGRDVHDPLSVDRGGGCEVGRRRSGYQRIIE